MYGQGRWGGRYLKPDGKALKAIVAATTIGKLPTDVEVGYTLLIFGNWYNTTKKSKTRIKKRDANNLVKLIVDAACEAVGIDDSQIFDERVRKVQDSTREGFEMKIYTLPRFE
jgi:Holliday junction resolvase RusA-like endonuclease